MSPRRATLTIGLPVYNGERSMGRIITDLRQQTYTDFDLIISDNASTDRTADIAQEATRHDPRIRYYRNRENLGLVGNYNRVMSLASGTWFKWATHDDRLDRTFVERCLEAAAEAPQAVLVCTGVVVRDIDGVELGRWTPDQGLRSLDPAPRTKSLLRTMGETYPLYGLIRTDALRRVGPLGAYLAADRVLLFRLALLGQYATLPEPLYEYTHYRPAGRKYSEYNDPASAGRFQMRTWRVTKEHFAAMRQEDLTVRQQVTIAGAVVRRFPVQDRRRLAAEVYHAGRVRLAGG